MQSINVNPNTNKSDTIEENKIVLTWSLTVFLVVMNTTMFNVALPNLLEDLAISTSTASWVVSGYSIVFAIATITYSRLSDFIPISRLLLFGLTLLAFASILGFFSNNFYLLLTSRIIQAAGAGAVPGLAMVLAGRYIPISRRGKAMAFISSAASLGFGLGPVIGGAITQYLGWNYLFVVTGLVGVVIPYFKKILPKEEMKLGRFDILGALLTGISVTTLLIFLSTLNFIYIIISVVLFVVLWKHIHKSKIPFISPIILKNKQYLKLIFIGFTAFTTHFAALFIMPILLTILYAREAAEIGLIIFPGAILSAFAAQIIGRLIDRFGNVPIIIFGQTFLLISTIMFSILSTISPYFILLTYMFMSLGFSALTSSVSNELTRILSKDELATGMGMGQLIQFFGGAFGVALAGFLLAIQQGIPEVNMFRNIFIVLIILVSLAVITFGFYYKMKVRMEDR